jgi:chromosomal replication initiator protein
VIEQYWSQCLDILSKEIPEKLFSLWIKPLKAISLSGDGLMMTVAAPNRFKLDWVLKNYADRMNEIMRTEIDPGFSLQFEIASRSANADRPQDDAKGGASSRPSASGNNNGTGSDSSNRPASTGGVTISSGSVEAIGSGPEKSRLHTELTFENFVSGKANQLARAAAEQVAANPGVSYNPLFLYGGVGLGKTHLIHAIGNHLANSKPSALIRYIHAEQYVSDVVKAYQRKAFDEFKRYYYSLDLLLIDDIQFFAGKSRTQEEFFYAFEQLIAGRKQIIITSDTYPKDIQGMDDRLISRFNSGLTVAIEPPELEMRVAILMKKAEQQNVPMGEEVAFFVAKHMRSNIRELEGALRRICAFASFHNRSITLDLARDALRDMISIHHGQVSVETIQKTVAEYYKIKVADMYSKRRPANIVLPRQVAMYLAKEMTEKSYVEIGELFGGRDHTTVLHAVGKINEQRGQIPELNHAIHVLEQTLKG